MTTSFSLMSAWASARDCEGVFEAEKRWDSTPVIISKHVYRVYTYQRSGASDFLARSIVLGAVARAHKLVLSLQEHVWCGRHHSALIHTPFHGTTQPKCVHTALTP